MGRKGPVPGAHENRPSTRTDLERQSAIWMTALGPNVELAKPPHGAKPWGLLSGRRDRTHGQGLRASGLLRLIPLRRRVAAVDISGATSRSALSARIIAMRAIVGSAPGLPHARRAVGNKLLAGRSDHRHQNQHG
jgi:hypothetical protein